MSVRKSSDPDQAAVGIKKAAVLFENDNEAVAVFPRAKAKAEEVVTALGLKPHKAVIMILGGAAGIDEGVAQRLSQLFGRGVARAAADADAVIIDGGTQSGVMAMIGEGVAGRGYKSQLIGVAPAGMVTYPGGPAAAGTPLEPNHSHFVLVDGNTWGSETSTMFNLAKALIGNAPGVAVLAGGGPVSKDEVLRAVRQELPLIVVDGSGGLASDVAKAWKQRETLPDDPVMAEIIADGEIHVHLLSNSVKGIERLIVRELGGDNVLMQAWEVFADYDLNANIQQKRFSNLQLAILLVGVAGTALAISQQVFGPKDADGNLLPAPLPDRPFEHLRPLGWWGLHQVLIIIPILLTVLVMAASRFKQGNKWLLLRAGAESIKREIYRYRARASYYEEDPEQISPEQQLTKKIEDITRRTMRTEVNTSALVPYNKGDGFPPYMYAAKGGDDGFSYLTPDRYVEVRLGDQLNYYKKTALKLERKLKALYWLTFIIGGVGTYLAATSRQVWIALTTAVVTALGTYLGYRQTESSLTKYNQTRTNLENVKAWWIGLSAEEQSMQQNINSLVKHTEQVLESELDGWVQQMQNALAELRKAQEQPTAKEERQGPKDAAHQTNPQQSGVRRGP